MKCSIIEVMNIIIIIMNIIIIIMNIIIIMMNIIIIIMNIIIMSVNCTNVPTDDAFLNLAHPKSSVSPPKRVFCALVSLTFCFFQAAAVSFKRAHVTQE